MGVSEKGMKCVDRVYDIRGQMTECDGQIVETCLSRRECR